MANPYLRFMNGDMPFWDFVSEMGGQQYAEQHGAQDDGDERRERRHRGPPGPHGRPPHGSGPFGFGGWSPFDMPTQEGPWGQGPWGQGHHEFSHRPHPRHRGGHERRSRHGPPNPEQPASDGEDVDTPPATPHDRVAPAADETMTLGSEDTITLQDNEKNDKIDKDAEVPDPDISTPNDDEKPRDGQGDGSDSDSDPCRRGPDRPWRRHGGPRGHWGGPPHHARGGFGGWPGRPHPHHPYQGGPWGGRRGHHGPAGPHGPHGPRGPHGGPGRHGPPPHHHPRGHDDPFSGAPGFDDLMRAFASDPRLQGVGDMIGNVLRATGAALNPDGARNGASSANDNDNNPDVDFKPSADIYDTADAYLVHVVVPGAKKEDVSVSWDGNSQELRVAGVVTRDGDEERLQSLALAERDVGVFERALKLGTDKVDEDAITARMADGILHITVPKNKEEEMWTEVRSVDIL